MGVYENAREQTRRAIGAAYWDIRMTKGARKATVTAIAEKAGIHRSTFYQHFNNPDEVFEHIENELYKLFVKAFETPRSEEIGFDGFLEEMQHLFDEHRKYLEPMLIQGIAPEFAAKVRALMKNSARVDIGIPEYKPGTREYQIVDLVTGMLTEGFIKCLAAEDIDLQDNHRLCNGIIKRGVVKTLAGYSIPCDPR